MNDNTMNTEDLRKICSNYKVSCIAVDFLNDTYHSVQGKQSDNVRYVLCTLTENGIARAIKNDETPRIRMEKPDHTYIYNDCKKITDSNGQNDGRILIHFTDQMLAVHGNAVCDIQLVSGDTSYSTKNFVVNIAPLPFDENTVKSTNEFQTLLQLTVNAEQAADLANDAAQSANEATVRIEQLEQNVQSSESEREEAETVRQEKEAERILAEKERVKKEVTRNNNENTRLSNETNRNNAEDTRTASENIRKQNESARETAETLRLNAETDRINSENARITAEMARDNAETVREANDTARSQKIEELEEYLSSSETTVTQKAAEAEASAAAAAMSENNADIYAKKAQSYAIGNTNTRPNESIDSAKYYYEQSRDISQTLSGALMAMGTVTFANLPELSDAGTGWMYNVSDQFTTTSDFKEGSGNAIPAGSNVYKTADGKWDVLAGTPVTTVNGQTGNVVIEKNDVGLGNVDNTSDEDKPVSTAQQNELNKKVDKSGDDMSGTLNSTKTTGTHLSGNQGQAIINSKAAAGAYTMLDKLNSTNGYFTDGVYQGKRLFQYTAKSTVDAGDNNVTKSVTLLDEDGNSQFPGTVTAPAFSGNATSATALQTPRTINGVAFDGTKNITIPSSLPAWDSSRFVIQKSYITQAGWYRIASGNVGPSGAVEIKLNSTYTGFDAMSCDLILSWGINMNKVGWTQISSSKTVYEVTKIRAVRESYNYLYIDIYYNTGSPYNLVVAQLFQQATINNYLTLQNPVLITGNINGTVELDLSSYDIKTKDIMGNNIYNSSGAITSSDRNLKNSISTIDKNLAESIIEGINPSSFKYNNGESGRTHYGIIAQDLEELIISLGIDPDKFAPLVKQFVYKYEELLDENGNAVVNENGKTAMNSIIDEDSEPTYYVRYEELIPFIIKYCQKMKEEIKDLNNEISQIKSISNL